MRDWKFSRAHFITETYNRLLFSFCCFWLHLQRFRGPGSSGSEWQLNSGYTKPGKGVWRVYERRQEGQGLTRVDVQKLLRIWSLSPPLLVGVKANTTIRVTWHSGEQCGSYRALLVTGYDLAFCFGLLLSLLYSPPCTPLSPTKSKTKWNKKEWIHKIFTRENHLIGDPWCHHMLHGIIIISLWNLSRVWPICSLPV